MGIASLLLERGLVTQPQLDEAVAEQRATGDRLDRVLVRQRVVSARDVLRVMGDQFHIPVVDLASIDIDPAVVGILPPKLVFRDNCLPLAREGDTLTVATSDPFELGVLDELRRLTGFAIRVVLADEEELRKAIRDRLGVGGDTLDAMSAGMEIKPGAPGTGPHHADDAEQAQEASVIKLVNDLIAEAIAVRATDVHIEPYEHELAVRYRVDGVLERSNVPPTIHRFGAAIVSRLKIMSSLNIAEKRRPQDGRIAFRQKGGEYDLRVSVIPMLFGEGVVLRVLNKSTVMLGLDQLGMPEHILGSWDALINRPHGILLVTGPTGSGKSTTLYASLNRIVSDEIKAITVEDPVEYHVPGVNQIQVNHKVGLDFAMGLRSILRHDPDVVMIGEIRDKETAETAIQASLTGHLVFSTLHTNDATGATTRLLDMGVEPFLVSSSLEGVLAQRLVRRVCADCAESFHPDRADLPQSFHLPPDATLARGRGCKSCRNTGYRGRLGVYELLRLSDPLRELIMEHASAPKIASVALEEKGLAVMGEDAFNKVRAGITTIEEVVRALAT
jgi:type II secretory ATPase GspE/PulE/Tfp pilus assembly ATPase PilB-like protein